MEDGSYRERLAAIGAVAAGVAHEISSPVSAVVVNLEQLRASLDQPRLDVNEVRQVIDDTLASMQVVLDLVRDLRTLGRADDDVPPEVVDVAALIRQVLRIAVPRDLLVEIDDPDEVPLLWLPRTRLMQIVTNLVTNAVHAMRTHAHPLHRLRVSVRLDESSLMVAIADTGGGIPASDLERVFERLYTTKDARTGTGLGLSLSREIVRGLGGDLTLDSVVGEGTIAMVFLPLALRSQVPGEPRASTLRRNRVLIVEEDAAQLQAIGSALLPSFELLTARSGCEAVDILGSGARIHSMVYDPRVRAGGAPLHEVVASHAPALLRRTVFLAAERAAPPIAAATVDRAAIDDELVDALEGLGFDDAADLGGFAERPAIL